MLNKIKSLTNTEDKKRLMSNFFSLSVLQGANYILPLITLPYLVRVLGIDNFGILAMATAVIMYLGILVDYGFNTTGTRAISINRNDIKKVEEIYNTIMFIKVFLLLVALLVLSFVLYVFDSLGKYSLIYFLTFGILIGQYLFPTWLFQGLEQMKYITYINLTSKLFFTVCLFIFVKNKEDLYIVPLLNSLGFIIGGIVAIFFINKRFHIRFKLPTSNQVKIQLKDGWNIFIASLSGNIYGQGNIILLGAFTTPAIVGYYSIAQKLTVSVVSIFQVFSQTMMPYLSNLQTLDKSKFSEIIKKTLKYSILLNTLMIGILLMISDFIYRLVSGESNAIGYYSFSFWLIIGFFTIINVVLHPILIALKQDKYIAKIYIFISMSFLGFATILSLLYSYKGMLSSMLIVEVLICLFSIYGVIKGVNRQ